jgi:hypothetical protein
MPDTPKLPELPQHVLDSMIPLDPNRPEPTFPKFASVAPTQIEKYAIELLYQGGEHMAEDDLDEGEVFAIEQEQDWRSACDHDMPEPVPDVRQYAAGEQEAP